MPSPRPQRVWGVVASGRVEDGAVRWVDRPDSSVNTCATAPALELGLRLCLLGTGPAVEELHRLDGALQARFRQADGLYVDNVDPDGRVDPTLWSYNQGTPVGAAVLWWRITGADEHLERAAQTAAAALSHFGVDDRLWSQPPVFVAVMVRNLLALDAVRPVAGLQEVLDGYLDRVWATARERGRTPRWRRHRPLRGGGRDRPRGRRPAAGAARPGTGSGASTSAERRRGLPSASR